MGQVKMLPLLINLKQANYTNNYVSQFQAKVKFASVLIL